MPLLAGLSRSVQSDISARQLPSVPAEGTAVADDFERWLSYLVEMPPWLSEAQQLRNRAAFQDIAESLHRTLTACQYHAVGTPPPAWLLQLVKFWNESKATVITFNYDVLVELAWLTAYKDEDPYSLDLYPVSIAPIGIRHAAVVASSVHVHGLRLLKLHGSLTWRYSGPSSPPNDPIYDVGLRGPWDIEGLTPINGDFEQLGSDKVPMVVPPAATKSPYYSNQLLRAMWQQAAEALRAANELIIMGFSLPPSDQLVGSLFATEIPCHADVIPVDRSDDIVKRLSALLGKNRISSAYTGRDDAIPAWVEAHANSSE